MENVLPADIRDRDANLSFQWVNYGLVRRFLGLVAWWQTGFGRAGSSDLKLLLIPVV